MVNQKKQQHDHDVRKNSPLSLSRSFQLFVSFSVICIASSIIWILWNELDAYVLLTWYGLALFISLVNGYLWLFRSKLKPVKSLPVWYTSLELGGLGLWVVLPIVLWPQESFMKQLFLSYCFVLLTLMKKPSHYYGVGSQLINLMLLVLIGRLLFDATVYTMLLAFMMFIYSVFLWFTECYFKQLLGLGNERYCNNSNRYREIKNSLISDNSMNTVIDPQLSLDLNGYQKNNHDVDDRLDKQDLANKWGKGNQSKNIEGKQNKKVVVVEDNQINQQVVSELLAELDVDISIANSGIQALEILEKETCDLILMDIQMPEMDGYETTRRIRKIPSYEKLPIVAMTAYALKEDRQRCLNAGMNDYTSKPFEPELFYQTVGRWLKIEPQQLEKLMVRIADLPQEKFWIENLPGIEQGIGLNRVKNNRALYYKILADFYEEYQNLIFDLNELLQLRQMENAARLLHRFKGAAGNVGATDAYFLSQDLESLIKSEQPYQTILDQFEQIFQQMMGGLAKIPRETQYQTTPTDKPIDVPVLIPLLAELSEHIRDASPQAVDNLPRIRKAANGHMNELFVALTEHLYTFRFDEAENILQQINQELKQHQKMVGG